MLPRLVLLLGTTVLFVFFFFSVLGIKLRTFARVVLQSAHESSNCETSGSDFL